MAAAVPREEKQMAAFIQARQNPLLLGMRDREPMSCRKWGRFRSLLLGERLEVAFPRQAWATPQTKVSPVIRVEPEPGWGLIGADQGLAGGCGLPCPAPGLRKNRGKNRPRMPAPTRKQGIGNVLS